MSFVLVWRPDALLARQALSRLLSGLPWRDSAERHHFDQGRLQVAFKLSSVLSNSNLAVDSDAGVVLVGDLRLDNRVELAHARGHSNAPSDAALALEMCVDPGSAPWTRLLGDFAFAAWQPSTRELVMVRDPAGVEPLYYSVTSEQVTVSSELRSLVNLPELRQPIDPVAVTQCLAGVLREEWRTPYANIRRLPPGHVALAAAGIVHSREYSALSQNLQPLNATDQDCAEALRATLSRAVECRLPRVGTTSVLLSGGLDSSLIAALAVERGNQPQSRRVLTVSAVFPDAPDSDERVYQREVVAALSSSDHKHHEHHEFRPQPGVYKEQIDSWLSAFADPTPIGPHWLAWSAAGLANSVGSSVLMTGIDGDRVISHGDGLLFELASGGQHLQLLRECAGSQESRLTAFRLFAGTLVRSRLPVSWVRTADRWNPLHLRPLRAIQGFLNPARVREAGLVERLRDLAIRPLSATEGHFLMLNRPDRALDLELTAAIGRYFGSEWRHPFFDRRVVELSYSFAGRQKRRGGQDRYVLRNAMAGSVPERVRCRAGKTPLDQAARQWMLGCLCARLRTLPAEVSELSSFLDLGALRKLELAARPVDSSEQLDFLWRCTIVASWFEWLSRSPPLYAASTGDARVRSGRSR